MNPVSLVPVLLALACAPGPTPGDGSPPGGADTAAGEPADPDGVWHGPCPTDTPEIRSVAANGITLTVACRGAGDTTVVFLHGFPEWHHAWSAVMDELAEDYRLVAPDQRGFNTSDKPTDVADYALPVLADDITALLPAVSAEPVLLVAHDWGGPVGWMVAHGKRASADRPHVAGFVATNGPHPVRFSELLATDPEQQAASAYMEYFRSEAANTELTPAVLSTWFGFLSDDDLALYQEAWSQPGAIPSGLNWYRANPLGEDSADRWRDLMNPTVDVPVAVLWGLDDDAVLPKNAEGLDPYAPDLVVETFAGVDHWIEHRIPEEVARAIREVDARR